MPNDIYNIFQFFAKGGWILTNKETGKRISNKQAYDLIAQFCRRINFKYESLIYMLFAFKRKRYIYPEEVIEDLLAIF